MQFKFLILRSMVMLAIMVPTSLLHAQVSTKIASKIIEDLTAPSLEGRGYVNDGDKKAANYLSEAFKQYGVLPFDESYFQEFNMTVNRFPDTIDLEINGKQLKTGIDYQVHPTSGSVDGTYQLIEVNKENFVSVDLYKNLYSPQGKVKDVALLFNPKGITNSDSLMEFQGLKFSMAKDFPVIYITDEKLTWGVANRQQNFPILEVKRETLPESLDSAYIHVNAELIEEYQTQNILGYIEGTKKKRKFVVVTAHYDHLGRMGSDAYIPGANDNASGTAMLLTLAKHYSENPPDYSVAFMLFGAEEAGLLGSKHYVDNPVFPLKRIEFLLNLDLLGTGSEGIKVVNATVHEEAFNKLTKINDQNDYLKKVAPRGEAANSDHYFFSKKGVPAFFVYTLGGPPHYHDVNDKFDTLPLTEFDDLHEMFVKFLDGFMD